MAFILMWSISISNFTLYLTILIRFYLSQLIFISCNCEFITRSVTLDLIIAVSSCNRDVIFQNCCFCISQFLPFPYNCDFISQNLTLWAYWVRPSQSMLHAWLKQSLHAWPDELDFTNMIPFQQSECSLLRDISM